MATRNAFSREIRGYPKELFNKNGISVEKYQCNECGLILREPVQAFCGHKFCKLCLEDKLGDGGPTTCQQCEKEGPEQEAETDDFSIIDKDKIFPDNATKREMAKFDVTCPNAGCGWKGKFKQYETHAAECKFTRILCENCGNLVKKNRFEKHQADQCKIQCTECRKHVLAGHLQEHKDKECPKTAVVCLYCGTSGILREKLSCHQQSPECHSEPIACPAQCGLIPLKDYQDHFKQMHHEIWAAEHLQKIYQKIERLQSESSSELQIQITPRLTQINERTTFLEQKVSEINQRFAASGISDRSGGTGNFETKVRQTVELQAQSVNERLDVKAGTFEGITTALKKEMEKTISGVARLETQRQTQAAQYQESQSKLQELERKLRTKELMIAELEMKINSLDAADDDGTIIWRVTEFSKKLQDARHGRTLSIYSSPFYSSKNGYKMCGRLYPNGDGMGKGSHTSLFFVIMRGSFDPLLKWPFEQKVYFCLINQAGGEHIIDSFRPDSSSSSFQRPASDMNIASGCPLFARQDVLLNPNTGFLKDDTLFIKIAVDVTGLAHFVSVPGDKRLRADLKSLQP